MKCMIDFIVHNSAILKLLILFWIFVIVPIWMYFAVKKYFPLELKDVFGGEKIKPEKVVRASGRLGILSFNGAFLKLSFYESFLAISYFGRCMVVKYSEKIDAGQNAWGTIVVQFPEVNSEIFLHFHNKEEVEYLKSRVNTSVNEDEN